MKANRNPFSGVSRLRISLVSFPESTGGIETDRLSSRSTRLWRLGIQYFVAVLSRKGISHKRAAISVEEGLFQIGTSVNTFRSLSTHFCPIGIW